MGAMNQVTQILNQMKRGEAHAAAEPLPLVYDELGRLGGANLAHEKPGQTLDGTAIVNEAYLRLARLPGKSFPTLLPTR
jgi:hypothetical protein